MLYHKSRYWARIKMTLSCPLQAHWSNHEPGGLANEFLTCPPTCLPHLSTVSLHPLGHAHQSLQTDFLRGITISLAARIWKLKQIYNKVFNKFICVDIITPCCCQNRLNRSVFHCLQVQTDYRVYAINCLSMLLRSQYIHMCIIYNFCILLGVSY